MRHTSQSESVFAIQSLSGIESCFSASSVGPTFITIWCHLLQVETRGPPPNKQATRGRPTVDGTCQACQNNFLGSRVPQSTRDVGADNLPVILTESNERGLSCFQGGKREDGQGRGKHPTKHVTWIQCWVNIGPLSATLANHRSNI